MCGHQNAQEQSQWMKKCDVCVLDDVLFRLNKEGNPAFIMKGRMLSEVSRHRKGGIRVWSVKQLQSQRHKVGR